MKFLTKSETGIVVEINHDEMREFEKLIYAVEGKTVDDYHREMHITDYHRDYKYIHETIDLTNVFGAIQAFYIAKFKTNEIEQGLQILKDALNGHK